jgi:3D (Asp-Asp-Asp) domain-containing protein
VAATSTPSGHGYWLAAADGGVFSFGDAPFLGSLTGTATTAHVTSITASNTGTGYWLTDAAGAIHAFGAARPVTSPPAAPASTPVVAAVATPSGTGHWELTGTPPPPPGPVVGASLGLFSVTCYDLGGITASGAPVGSNVVATDPRVIPLGTTIWIDGIGERTALDTGGAIKGNRLDVWMPTYSQCAEWGRQTRAVNLVTP